jgi:rare lipoprotein A
VKDITMTVMMNSAARALVALAFISASFPCVAEDIASLQRSIRTSGLASWYGAKYRGKRTASGERFDPSDLTAAHPDLPMGTLLEVSRPDTHRRVVVRVNDRGPGGGRVLDLSEAAARRLDMVRDGTALVALQVIGSAD